MEDYDYLFKIVVVGSSGVGKTCMIRRFVEGFFPPGNAATIGVDFLIKNVTVGTDRVKLQMWDTAGQERFKCITQSFYRAANAVVVVYDITNEATFDSLPEYLQEIDKFSLTDLPVYLVGNKCDVTTEREVSYPAGTQFAAQHKLRFTETSAKAGEKIEDLFVTIATDLTSTHARIVTQPPTDLIIPDNSKEVDRSCCVLM